MHAVVCGLGELCKLEMLMTTLMHQSRSVQPTQLTVKHVGPCPNAGSVCSWCWHGVILLLPLLLLVPERTELNPPQDLHVVCRWRQQLQEAQLQPQPVPCQAAAQLQPQRQPFPTQGTQPQQVRPCLSHAC